MKAIGQTSGYAFTGNPIVFQEGEIQGVKGGEYRVTLGEESVYAGKFTLPVTLNLSDIAEAITADLPLADPANSTDWVYKADEWTGREMKLWVDYDNGVDLDPFRLRLLHGRASTREMSQTLSSGEDIFTRRFLNRYRDGEIFLTSRFQDPAIQIPETEIYPLCFMALDGDRLTVVANGKTYKSETLEDGMYWFDIDKLRRNIFMDSNGATLLNTFSVGFEGEEVAVEIQITAEKPMKNRHRILFRNDYGIPELLDLSGELSFSAGYESQEESEYMVYYPLLDKYRKRRKSLEAAPSLKISTGIVSPKKFTRVLEMLRSGWVAIESPADGEWVEVIAKSDDISFDLLPEEPVQFEITMNQCDDSLSLLEIFRPTCAKNVEETLAIKVLGFDGRYLQLNGQFLGICSASPLL